MTSTDPRSPGPAFEPVAADGVPGAVDGSASGPPEPDPGPPARFGDVLARYAAVAVLVALDLWSKAAVFAWLQDPATELVRDGHGHQRRHVLGDSVEWFTFMLSENPGAAFGQFGDHPHALIGLRVVAVLFLLTLIFRARRGQPLHVTSLVLVLAGALGNLYDNLFLPAEGGHPYGKVRDFIDVYFAAWDWHFPTFNVADSCITVGAALLLLGSFAGDREARGAGDAAAGSGEAPPA
jgi:signal peptidase II